MFDGDVWTRQHETLLGELPADVAASIRRATVTALKQSLAKPKDAETWFADTVLQTAFADPAWLLPGILPMGLATLGGRPKVGKSFLALQMAWAVGTGGVLFGRRVEPGPVLYLALEDSLRRLKNRIERQGWQLGVNVEFVVADGFRAGIGDLRNGGFDRLAGMVTAGHYRLVVVDTISRAVNADPNDQRDVGSILGPLQELAQQEGNAVLLIDHHRKSVSLEPSAVDDLLGATAKSAVCDTLVGLSKQRGVAGARLHVVGRDVEEQTLQLAFDMATGCWQMTGAEGQLAVTPTRAALVAVVEEVGPCSFSDLIGITGKSKSTLYEELQNLVNAGALVREPGRGGRYVRR